MARDKDFHDYILYDIFSEIPGITSRQMFGGYGFYRYGRIFAIMTGSALFFKVGENNRSDFEEYGSEQFVYTSRGRDMKLGYWRLPDEILENRSEIEEWIEKSLQVAQIIK